ncbi:MAG: hypothetical protein MJ054_02605 [Clostridia bacterium]|nr:hypothetical protein [Clostridia bacterium]
MFDNNLEQIFQKKHVTVILCYDRDCQKNLCDNLCCDLDDMQADYYAITLDSELPSDEKQVFALTNEISQLFTAERHRVNATGRTFTPEHLLVDLNRIEPFFNSAQRYQEFCAQLSKLNDFAQKEEVGVVIPLTIDNAWDAALFTTNYINEHLSEIAQNFTIFVMQEKDPNQLTFTNGPLSNKTITIF